MPGRIEWQDTGATEFISELTGGDLVLAERDSDSTVLLEWDETNSKFQFRGEVELNSNDVSGVNALTATSVDTDELNINGKLYEFDGTLDASNVQSVTYSMNANSDEVILLPESLETDGWPQLRVNGDTGSNYDIIQQNGNQPATDNKWSIARFPGRSDYLKLQSTPVGISFHIKLLETNTTAGILGENNNVSGPITQFTLLELGGSRSGKARVYRRDLS